MAEWKYGTVVEASGAKMMLICPAHGLVSPLDDGYKPDSGWVGITLFCGPYVTAWGSVGGTTWVPGDWSDIKVLDE